jgi:hypothetical protein
MGRCNFRSALRSSGMRMKYLTLLIASLVLVAQSLYDMRILAQDKEKPVDAPIQTDKKIYKVAVTSQSVKFTINYSYVNRTSRAVFLPTCRTPYRPLIEKKIEGRWVTVFQPVELMCAGPPVRIEPGEKYRDTFDVEAFLPGNNMHPEFKVDVREIEGLYRLVHLFSGQDQILPMEERISNEFKLTR